MARISFARSLHDLGLAGWFGGGVMGAIGLNGAAAVVVDETERPVVASAGWAKWAPVNAAFISAHLIGGALIVKENTGRIKGQRGVAGWTLAKTVLTGAALASTAASGLAGAKVAAAGRVPTAGGTEPTAGTPSDVAAAQKQLKALQWITPALTGAIINASAAMGEQQRPSEVLKGGIARVGQAARHPGTTARALDPR